LLLLKELGRCVTARAGCRKDKPDGSPCRNPTAIQRTMALTGGLPFENHLLERKDKDAWYGRPPNLVGVHEGKEGDARVQET